ARLNFIQGVYGIERVSGDSKLHFLSYCHPPSSVPDSYRLTVLPDRENLTVWCRAAYGLGLPRRNYLGRWSTTSSSIGPRQSFYFREATRIRRSNCSSSKELALAAIGGRIQQ